MSLLDDVSIVVTPNGYKAGTLYGVLPTPTEGAEEVINGDFDGGTTDWNLGNAVWQQGSGNGEVKLTKPSSGNSVIYQTGLTFAANTVLRYRFNIVDYSGLVSVRIDGYSGSNPLNTPLSFTASEGNVDVYVTTDRVGSSVFLYLTGGNTGDYVVLDNVSVKVWTGADMDVTRATAATRVDEDGLVNYAEILGSEEVINGDFATDSDWIKDTGWEISGNQANCDGTDGAQLRTVDSPLTNGKTYYISYQITAYTSGSIDVLGQSLYGISGNSETTVTGIFVATKEYVRFYSSSFNGSIDNVTVKQLDRNNVPRIDYTGGCPHILAEPERTNVITQNNQFDTTWVTSNLSLTSGQNGIYNTTDAWLFNATNSLANVTISVSTSGENTYSVYAKAGTEDGVFIRFTGGSNPRAFFNLTNGTLIGEGGTTNTNIENIGNGWYRCSVTGSETITDARIYVADASGNFVSSGNIYVQYSQLENGSYSTSIIPTSGSTVTRNQDVFSRDGIASLINSEEGVLYAEIAALDADSTYRYISFSDGTADNSVRIYLNSNGTQLSAQLRLGGVVQCVFNYTVSNVLEFNKIAFKYKENDFALWIGGVERDTDTSGSTFSADTLNELSFDRGDGTQLFFGKVKQLQVYNTALTDEQLLQLTGESGTDFYESYAEMAAALTYTIQ